MQRTQAHLRKIKPLLSQQPQTDRLARDGRNGGDTDVNWPSFKLQVDTSVLWQSPLRNIQMRHDFNSGDQGSLKQFDPRRDRNIPQNSVDPVSHLKIVLQRLNVNIGRPLLQSFSDNLIHKLDDRGLRIVLIQNGRLLFQIVG